MEVLSLRTEHTTKTVISGIRKLPLQLPLHICEANLWTLGLTITVSSNSSEHEKVVPALSVIQILFNALN